MFRYKLKKSPGKKTKFKPLQTKPSNDLNKLSLISKEPEKQFKQLIEKHWKQSEASKNLLKLSKSSWKVSAFFSVSRPIGKPKRNYSCDWMISLHPWNNIKKTLFLKIDWWNCDTIFKNLSLRKRFCLKKSDKCFKLLNGVKP